MTFRLTLATPDKVHFDGPVDAVGCPGTRGRFAVLAGHAPMVAGLSPGILTVSVEAATRFFVIDGGLAEVNREHTQILTRAAVTAANEIQAEAKLEEMRLECPRHG